MEWNDHELVDGCQQLGLIDIGQNLGSQNPGPGFSAEGREPNDLSQADIEAQRWVRGSSHSQQKDSVHAEMDYGSTSRKASAPDERVRCSPTKRHRGSTSHQTRTDGRHRTKAKVLRDSSPGSSSSSRSRSGSRIGVRSKESPVVARVGSLRTEVRNLLEMAVAENPKRRTEMKIGHQAGQLSVSLQVIQALEIVTQIRLSLLP